MKVNGYVGLNVPSYLHRIEYRRELSKEKRVHEFTEMVDSHAFYFGKSGMSMEEYWVYSLTGCADDFLERMNARAGSWLITLYREYVEPPVHMCTIRMQWDPPKALPRNGS